MVSAEQSQENLISVGLHLGQQVLPIYEFAERTQPHTLIICDRDARPIGTAFEAIRSAKNGLPSLEQRVYYERISKNVDVADLTEVIKSALTQVIVAGRNHRIMVIDDYVSNRAGTLRQFNSICRRLGVESPVDWVTLSGKGTAFNAQPYRGATTTAPWRDRPDVLGIDYEGVNKIDVPSPLSCAFYAAIHEGVRRMFI